MRIHLLFVVAFLPTFSFGQQSQPALLNTVETNLKNGIPPSTILIAKPEKITHPFEQQFSSLVTIKRK